MPSACIVLDRTGAVPAPHDGRECSAVSGRGDLRNQRKVTDEEQDGYYYGFANEGMWPLCHIAIVRPQFRESDWRAYQAVNERFADAVAIEAQTDDPIVLLQDYHFALLPRLIRERLPWATVITFWHIPWPNAETFGACPWKQEIIHGLLGSTILGFHTVRRGGAQETVIVGNGGLRPEQARTGT